MSGLLWGRVQRTKEFNGQGGRKVRSILLPVPLFAVFLLTFMMLFLLPATSPAQAQGGYSPWRTFTKADGLAANRILSMLQTSNGTLWFGTDSGVSFYDGMSWQTFGEDTSVAGKMINSIFQDSHGALWFGTWGVSRYDGTAWRHYTTADGLVDNSVNVVFEDRNGILWFGTRGGISRYDGQNWQSITADGGLVSNVIWSICEGEDGILWFGTDKGVSRYDGNSWQTGGADSGLGNYEVRTILEDRDGMLWFGTWGGGVSYYDGSAWQTFTYGMGLANNAVSSIFQTSDGVLWFGTDGGVSRYDGHNWQTFTQVDGLVQNYVSSILEDADGALWLGTAVGVSRYDRLNWQTFTAKTGLASNDVWSILGDRDGVMWFGTNKGVSRYDGKGWQTLTTEMGLVDSYVESILQDKDGVMWFGTPGGLSRYDGMNWQTFTKEDGLADSAVRSILQDREGILWFGTDGGVSRYDGRVWETFSDETNGLASKAVSEGVLWVDTWVSSILQDREGALWFGTWGGGVNRYDGATWQTFTAETSGLPSDYVKPIMEDLQGALWFGTDAGVTRYNGSTWQTFTTENSGLADNHVWSIVEDGKGLLWFGTDGGVSCYDGTTWQTFTAKDGLEAKTGVHSIFRAKDDALWFGSIYGGGVSRHLSGDSVPLVYVAAINGHPYDGGVISLPYSENNVTIAFVGGDLRTLPENLLYLYKMDGVDEKWQGTTEKSASYYNLDPGTYTFHVKARDEDFNYTDPPAVAQIAVEQPPATPTPRIVAVATPTSGPTPTPIIMAVEPTVDLPFLGSVALTTLYASVGLLVVVGLIAAFSVSRFRAYQRTRRAIKRQENPYITNVPVSDPKMFFGRQEILNQIVNGIHLNNFAVCGPKRIGKTSLLHRLAAELCQMDDAPCSFFPVLLSLHGVPESRLFRALMLDIAREYRSQIAPLSLRCRAAGEYNAYDFLDDLDAVQETLQQAIGGKSLRLVLLIDEGDALNGYSQAILAQLRFAFMGPALNYLKMVWSGEDLDRRKWKLRGSDWLTVFGHVFHLTPFTEEEAIRLIVEPVPYYRYDKQAVRLILDHSQLIPHRIQLLCWGAVEEMLKARRGRITVEDVEASLRHLTGEIAPPGIQPLTISALAADSREQPAHRLTEGGAEYHTNLENEEAE